MQLTVVLTAFIALAATTIPGTSAATWNSKLQVWDLGRIPSEPGWPGLAKEYPGKCGGIPEGGYACGSFGPGKIVAMRAIYQCEKGWLTRVQVCGENDLYNRCVKNGRRKGKKFFPFVDKSKIVCQKKSAVEKA